MLFPQNKLRPSSCGCRMRTVEGVVPQSAKASAIADLTPPISDEYHESCASRSHIRANRVVSSRLRRVSIHKI